MTDETIVDIQGKLAQARRLLQQTPDAATADGMKTYIEELERRLVALMGQRHRSDPLA